MATPIPFNAGFISVTTTSSKTFQLPLSTDLLGRVLTFKDSTGGAATNPIQIQTQGGDTFQDGTTTYTISQAYDSATFVSRSGKWVLSSSSGITQPQLTSTIGGLGTAGYISTLSMTSSINASISSFSTSLGFPTNFTSTVQGLGSAGYISTPSLTSSLISTATFVSLSFSSFSTTLGQSLSLPNLTSTVTGLGSAGYISSLSFQSSLVSTTKGLETYISTFIDPTELASSITSTVAGLAITSNLASTVTGLGSSGYVSTLSLISTTNFVSLSFSSFSTGLGQTTSGLNLLSTVTGLGSAGYVSTLSLTSSLISTTNFVSLSFSSFSTGLGQITSGLNLVSTVTGLGSAGYVSTLSLISTTNFVSLSFSSFSTAVSLSTTFNLRSTVGGLGQIYLSSIPLLLSTGGLFTSSILASTITTSSLQVNSLTIGTGTGWINLGPLQTVAISAIQANVNDGYINNLYVGNQSTVNDILFYGLFGNYNNTVLAEVSTGAGTQEMLIFKGSSTSDRVRVQTTGTFVVETGVSARLFNSNTTQTLSNATPAFIINSSSNVGIQTATPGTALDVAGIARAITLSSQQLFVSSFNGDIPVTRNNILSTVTGLGSIGYVSTSGLAAAFASTLSGLPIPLNSNQLISTTRGLETQIQTSGFLSSANLLNLVSTNNLLDLVSTSRLNSALASTVFGLPTGINSNQLISTTAGVTLGYQTSGFLSTQNLLNLVSTNNLLDLVSTSRLNSALASTVFGLPTSVNSNQLISTTAGVTLGYQTSGFLSTNNLLNLVSTNNLLDLVSTSLLNSALASTVFGLPTSVNSNQLISTTAGVTLGYQTSGFLSSANLLNLVSTNNLLNLVSTNNLLDLVSTPLLNSALASTVFGLPTSINSNQLISTTAGITTAYQTSGFLSTANLLNLVSTNNLLNLVSTNNLLDLVSTSRLNSALISTTNFVSLSFSSLSTSLGLVDIANFTSTVTGLGSARYVSTLSLVSTTVGIESFVSTAIQAIPFVYAGATVYMNYSVTAGTYKALENTITTGPQQSLATLVNGNTANNFIVGFQSDFSLPIEIPVGIWRVVLFCQASGANVTTYPELYLRDALGTETLVASESSAPQTVPTTLTELIMSMPVPQTTIPTGSVLVLKIFANNTASPNRTFTTYFENGTYSYVQTTFGVIIDNSVLTSSIIGLGSLGYVSSLSLVSTTAGITKAYQTAGFVSTPNLLNLVSTNNLLSLVSTPNLLDLVSTSRLDSALASTVFGLPTGINSNQLISTTAGVTLGYQTAGFLSTNNLLNLVSTNNLLDLVSTSRLDSALASTVSGLPTSVNSNQLISTTAGVTLAYQTSGFLSTPNLLNLVSTNNLLDLVSTSRLDSALASTVSGLPTSVNSNQLISTTAGVTLGYQTAGFLSTPNLLNLVSTNNLLDLVSTSALNSALASTVFGLPTGINSNQLISTTSGIETEFQNAFLTILTSGFVSTPNLIDLVSTSYLQTQFASSFTGLSNIAVTKITAGSNITISPLGGQGNVTINASGGGSSIPENLSTFLLKTSTILASSVTLYDTTGVNPEVNYLYNYTGVTISKSLYGFASSDLTDNPGKIFAKSYNISAGPLAGTAEYTYSIGAGAGLTGTISTPTITDETTGGITGLYLSSLYLGNSGGTPVGQITTDATATNLFWKGSQLNNQTGGGGGSAVPYISAFTVSTGSVFASTVTSYLMSSVNLYAATLNMSVVFV